MKKIGGFLFLLVSLLFSFSPVFAAPGDLVIGVEDGWIWQVVILPPFGGWESEKGVSALGAVRYAEWKVKDSAEGVAGRDIRFLKEPPVTEENVAERVASWKARKISAVLSFRGGEDIALLRAHIGREGPVFLSAFGEDGDLYESGVVLPMMFALDLFKDFRIEAFFEYAKKNLKNGAVVAVLGDKLDPALERYARNLGDKLASGGFSVRRFWIPGAGNDSFWMIESEAMAEGAEVFVSWAGSMVVRDVWRGTRRKEGAFRIWYGGEPKLSLLSFDGILMADQGEPVRTDHAFITLGREIWKRNKTSVQEPGMAGRAYTACQWIFEGFRKAGSPDVPSLAAAMRSVVALPFGSRIISINPATHRPFERETAFLEVKDHCFHSVDIFPVKDPGYLP